MPVHMGLSGTVREQCAQLCVGMRWKGYLPFKTKALVASYMSHACMHGWLDDFLPAPL